jgi:hypothetical protein
MSDLLLRNGRILTMDPAKPEARSIACTGGKVESLDEEPTSRQVVDLQGATVVPGFVDAHAHLLWTGRKLRELDLAGVADPAELVRRVVERAKAVAPGTWITGHGYELPEGPAADLLSVAVPAHPVWLVRKDAHSGIANARAMERADLSSVPAGGSVMRERGLFLETATALMEAAVPPVDPAADVLAAQREALRRGVTSIHDAKADDELLRILLSLEEGRSLRVRVHAMVWQPSPGRAIDFMRSRKPSSGPRLNVRAVKVFMDGSLGSGSAWMLDPARGTTLTSAADLERIGRVALETGWQLCVHAIGDAANRAVLDVFEKLDAPESARWRIEHAQHVHPDDLPRTKRWICSVQPSHEPSDRPLAEARLSTREREGTHAWRRLGPLALGSDAPVEPLDPRRTFVAAVFREGGEALDRGEALRAMTAGAAFAGFQDVGVLAPGRPADLGVLSCDWREASREAILGSELRRVVMDGRTAVQARP